MRVCMCVLCPRPSEMCHLDPTVQLCLVEVSTIFMCTFFFLRRRELLGDILHVFVGGLRLILRALVVTPPLITGIKIK